MGILIFAETDDKGKFKKDAFEIASFAFEIGTDLNKEVTALCFNATNPEKLSAYGVKKVINSNNTKLKDFDPEIYSECICEIFDNENCNTLILSSSSNSKYIGGILSVKLDAGYVTNVISKPIDGEILTVKRNTFTNKAFETVEILKANLMLALSKNSFGFKENPCEHKLIDYDFNIEDPRNKIMSIEKTTNKVTIADADVVISGGRGLKGPENWHLIENLADVLGGATACSKPVSDLGWRPHSEHVGQTGKPVSSNLYIAIGISGAIQHLAGVNSSKTKVVINTDPDAPFFKAADYGIVGDAFEVVPKLIDKLKEFKSVND
jgi:electron transfer flavoprotein alpha subunit